MICRLYLHPWYKAVLGAGEGYMIFCRIWFACLSIKNDVLLNLLMKHSSFYNSPIHGLGHWQTVERNGHYLAQFTGADTKVISCFAYFHDCMRENENIDPQHGLRGARFAEANKDCLDLNEQQLATLILACTGHTGGHKASCVTVETCWDADRLDIGRVGIEPDSNYLFGEEAKRIADYKDMDVLRTYREVKLNLTDFVLENSQ